MDEVSTGRAEQDQVEHDQVAENHPGQVHTNQSHADQTRARQIRNDEARADGTVAKEQRAGEARNPLVHTDRELRLAELRREAALKGHTSARGIQPSGAPFPRATPETGYYGRPALKAPAWTWEVPLYFFAGGAAGSAAVIASVAQFTGADPRLIRDARAIAAIGGAISPALLISDLGMPSRFLHMLRVFKIQSPMSVGSWTLVAFSNSAAASAFLGQLRRKSPRGAAITIAENAAQFVALISGLALATYTGVLIGATAVPVWNTNISLLPIHFATSGMAAATSMLELRGHDSAALNAIGFTTALAETAIGASIELRKDRALRPLKHGRSGWLTRLGGLLSGPLPLALRIAAMASEDERKTQFRKMAAASAVAGSLVTRFAWTQAGHASAADPKIPLELPDRTALAELQAKDQKADEPGEAG
jgi:Polysulphide reductase, NrfD